MLEDGGFPRFMSVQAGARSALGDVYPTDKPWLPGELLRLDVGCTVAGYWSDMARTAVLGTATPLQRTRFDALLAGLRAELDAIKPGVRAAELFDIAMRAAREHGLREYRRQHCGHGIGLSVYEPPMISPGVQTELQEGMVFSLETPYYELGWGGILTEDMVVVTAHGCERLTTSSQELRKQPL
jgi:Xaa-Pro aminopeptidase